MKLAWDVIFKKNGKDYGYMLAAQSGQKKWEVSDTSLLPPMLVTGKASTDNYSPEEQIYIKQDDWRGGFQDLLFQENNKYCKSKNCDGRCEGQFILSPEMKTKMTIPLPTSEVLTNASFEEGAKGLTGWTASSETHLTKQGSAYDGDYCVRLSAWDSSATANVYQDVSWHSDFQGRTFTFSLYHKEDGVPSYTQITIDDGIDTTSSAEEYSLTWEKISVTKVLASNATKLKVNIKMYQTGAPPEYPVYIDLALVTFETGDNCAAMLNFGGSTVLAIEKAVYKEASGTLTRLKSFTTTVADLCVFKTTLYIALGYANKYWYTDDLGTFTESTRDDGVAQFMSNVGNSQFWVNHTNYQMRDTGTPKNGGAAFSEAYDVGSSSYDITALLDHPTVVYARKQDNLYYLSGANVLPLIPELSALSTTSIDYDFYRWKGRLYIPAGTNSLFEYIESSGATANRSFSRYAVGDSDYNGRIRSLTSDEEYLYALINNGDTEAEILSGAYLDGVWAWHPIWGDVVTTKPITSSLISPVSGEKLLYIGTEDVSDGVIRFSVPEDYFSPLTESGHANMASGDIYTPWFRSDFASLKKLVENLSVVTKCITDKTSMVIYYELKGDTSWTELGKCSTDDLVGTDYPPEISDTFLADLVSERIRFKFHLEASDTGYSPILYGLGGGFALQSKLVDSRKKKINFTIRLGRSVANRAGVISEKTVPEQITDMEMLDTSTTPITLIGPDEIERKVLLRPVGIREQMFVDEKRSFPEFWVVCEASE